MEPSAIIDILKSGQFELLLGVHESFTVEFKGAPYRLTESHQKHELAKDVSAFANAAGGVVVLGVRTERSDSRPADISREIRPIDRSLIDPRQYLDTVQSWIYPCPQGCTVELFSATPTVDIVLVAIWVPAQLPSAGPFLVTRVVAEASDHIAGVTVALYERLLTGSVGSLSPQELQSLLRDGRLFRRALDERSRGSAPGLEQMGGPIRKKRAPSGAPSDTIQKAASLVEATGLSTEPAFILTATPKPLVDASRMFASDEDPTTRLLAHPPEIREMGFGLSTLQHPEIVEGRSRRALLRGYKGLEFWNDGALVFVVTGGEEFLCWGNRAANLPLRIQPVPLLEATYLFCALAQQLYSVPPLTPDEVDFALHLRRMCINGARPILTTGRGRSGSDKGARSAPDCDLDVHVADFPTATPGAVAYDLVKQIYSLFGLTYDAIPYVANNQIDPEAIRPL